MSDPKLLSPADVERLPRDRAAPFDADATSEEALELGSRGRLIDLASRVRARLARGEADPLQAETQASLARIRYWSAQDLGPRLGVPRGEGVLDMAARDVLPPRASALAVRDALAWRRSGPRHRALLLAVLGTEGVGKTVALAHAVIHHSLPARFVHATDLPGDVEHSSVREELARLRGYDLLAIDDLGREPDPTRVRELLLRRYGDGRITLCAGNLTAQQFRERYCDGPLCSRLAWQVANGQRATVTLREPDMRRTPR
ncbi:MAG TPA: hypothetical protein VHH11_14045 [Gammaproteobacteria bacterium]|nr:hypothetical protein [Gammaproteobacteria bacterium]